MNNEPRIDFEAIWQRVEEARLDAEDAPAVWGGRFQAASPETFLSAWLDGSLRLPWRVWAHTDAIAWGSTPDSRPQRPQRLVRAELFGPDGHLSLRRDGADRWQWRFVGRAGVALPEEVSGQFWRPEPGEALFRYEEQAILWGKEVREKPDDPAMGAGLWWEDRVAFARLAYPPHLRGIERVYLHFYRYTQAGRTVLVQYRGLGNETMIRDTFHSK